MLLGLVYPCLLGARMLGSTLFPWLIGGPLSLRFEVYLVYAFITMGFVLSIVAYDYQVWMSLIVELYILFALKRTLVNQKLTLLLRYAGNMVFSDAFLRISCLCWLDFTFACQIEDHVNETSSL